ncbi:hypothetical protein ACHAXH_003075, partial [Discostella pseudostelligera]
NDVCPLCCEDLDLSDKQFYPCKCGYQVCMWCWHRIKESESGLCPACRTPYGDDPHEFSAVDMEEVVKANKEKAVLEKRERERLRAMREQEKREQLANYVTPMMISGGGGGSGTSLASNSIASSTTNFAGALVGGGSNGGTGGSGGMQLGATSTFGSAFDGADLVAALGSSSVASTSLLSTNKGPPEPPKDRTTLAAMRVIRRNLVYAVGMPPAVATEENLRKPEYFGQYGKISKIVINRNHNPGGDPRRASASAYVTFAHKEDTLACILALDGFYHDGRNVRASYGTSKYCSAFIKNVRCNNPDCTYLHHMGDAEDTFTKQEIQAGYVTSGRDVLARQQQIMAQQAAAAFGNGGACRKRVGGGGPSGTGKASASPIFPPPTFDEPVPRKVISKAQSTILQSKGAALPTGQQQHGIVGNVAPSAASIVAGIGTTTNAAPPAPHTTLTTLTSLKRAGSMPLVGKSAIGSATIVGDGAGAVAAGAKPTYPLVGAASDLTPAESLALEEQYKEAALQQQQAQQMIQAQKTVKQKQQQQQQQQHAQTSSRPNSPSQSSVGSGSGLFKRQSSSELNGVPLIGAISGSNLQMGFPLIGTTFSSGTVGGTSIVETPTTNNLSSSLEFGGSGILGGKPLPLSLDDGNNGVIGGASFASTSNSFGLDSLSSDKWGNGAGNQNNVLGSGSLWGGDSEPINRPAPIGPASSNGIEVNAFGGDVGGMSLFGTNSNAYSNGNGSSALASMLGIDLPTGLGTLRENSSTFSGGTGGSSATQAPVGSVGIASAGGMNIVGNRFVGAIGANKPNNGTLQPIGAPSVGGGITIGGYSSGVGNDMALLQSLLPGVNITSGNSYHPAPPRHPQYQQQQMRQQAVGVGGLNSSQWNSGNNNSEVARQQHEQQQQRSSNIW